MSARSIKSPREVNNYIAEWFGFRVWPTVDTSETAKAFQAKECCPFLTVAANETVPCVKVVARGDLKGMRTGVCTISSTSNGRRQDWLACPFRILDTHFTLLDAVVRRLYAIDEETRVVLRPVIALQSPAVFAEVTEALPYETARVFVFSQQAFGGEITVPQTSGSPELEIDSTVVELLPDGRGGFRLGRYVFFEIQTMDFHGSPLHAVTHLVNVRRSDPEGYHSHLAAHPEWIGEKVEGPNKANVFKRTIYQTILEIQFARDPNCAGFAIAIPEAVWDSWQAHLGLPALELDGDLWRLKEPAEVAIPEGYGEDEASADESSLVEPDRAWIFIFDIDRDSAESPQPLKIVKTVVTTSAALIHYAFEQAPQNAVDAGALARFTSALEDKVRIYWATTGSGTAGAGSEEQGRLPLGWDQG